MEQPSGEVSEIFDAVIVGGGLGGVFMLAEAIQQRYTKILLLERAASLGGVWANVPSWQTIQNHPLDFCLQGFTTRKQVWHAGDVLHYLAEYVRVQNLEPYIRISRNVTSSSWSDAENCWVLQVLSNTGTHEEIRCRTLLLCTGKHTTPVVPLLDTDGSVPIVHSSQLHRWEDTKGKNVVVIGGGASALDLCMKVLQSQETDALQGRLYWVLRSPKFFSGAAFSYVWPVTILQLLLGTKASTPILNTAINAYALLTFWWWGLLSWLPPKRFDLRDTQYVPGRNYLLRNSKRICRHAGVEIKQIRNHTVTLTDGATIEDAELILLGTGYAGPAHMAGVGDLDSLYVKTCATGKHLGRLFLVGENLLDTTGATPAVYHVFSRVFWTLLHDEKCLEQLPRLDESLRQPRMHLNNMDIINHVVSLGTHNSILGTPIRSIFPFFTWRMRLCCTYIYYAVFYRTTVLFSDRVLGYNMCLDNTPRR